MMLQVVKSVPHMKLKCGEPYLRIAADHENDALNDEDSRSKGPKIDMIFRNTRLNIDIAVLEISGPNHKINQVHNLDDRYKLAKNLKIMLTNMLSTARYASPVEKRKIKLYGFHIYLNKIAVYSLQKPDDNNFVFTQESYFAIPTNCDKLQTELANFIANFIAHLWSIEGILSSVNENIKTLLESLGQHTVTTASSGEDTPHRPVLKSQRRQ